MARTVLLIDYDPRSIESIKRLLRVSDTRLILARDGRSGLEEYHRSRPDLTVIQDLIPILHGFDVCREIKRSEGGADHPVVLLCRHRSHAVLVDTKCDAYLKKPYDDEELLKVLNRLLPEGLVSSATDPVSTDGDPLPDGATRTASQPPSRDALEVEIEARVDDVLGPLGGVDAPGPSSAKQLLPVP